MVLFLLNLHETLLTAQRACETAQCDRIYPEPATDIFMQRDVTNVATAGAAAAATKFTVTPTWWYIRIYIYNKFVKVYFFCLTRARYTFYHLWSFNWATPRDGVCDADALQ